MTTELHVNCETGEEAYRDLSAEEEAAFEASRAGRADLLAGDPRRQADLALLAAGDDPHHQALARLLGGGG